MSDLSFLEQTWDHSHIKALVQGLWYERKQAAYDRGQPEDLEELLDALQIERDLAMVPDIQERAAVTLAMMCWVEWDIGAAIRSHRTGHSLVKGGVRALVRINERRAEMRQAR